MDKVLAFYNTKIDSAVKTSDLYPQQHLVMNLLAKEAELKIENQLPHVPLAHLSKYNKSKLVIKDQWSSHPSTKDRVEALTNLNITPQVIDNRIAIALFQDSDAVKAMLTSKIFSTVGYECKETLIHTEQFMEEFQALSAENSFPKIYRGYYDDKNPKYNLSADIDSSANFEADDEIQLFDDSKIDLVYTSHSLSNDIEALKQLGDGNHSINTFDYDGQKYNVVDCAQLIEKLERELADIQEKIRENDLKILNYFNFRAKKAGKQTTLLEKYSQMETMDSDYEASIKLHNEVAERLGFIHEVTPFATITNRFFNLKPKEFRFKEKIKEILIEPKYQKSISTDARTNLEKYIEREHEYFWEFNKQYNDAALEALFNSLRYFLDILLSTYFEVKRELLVYQATLAAKV